MEREIEDKTKQIDVENYIWVIYIGIIFLYIAIYDFELEVEIAFN